MSKMREQVDVNRNTGSFKTVVLNLCETAAR